MYPSVIALCLMCCIIGFSMVIRSKSKKLGKLLVPVNVISGIIGLVYMNTINDFIFPDVTVDYYSVLVEILFTMSFISIGLASVKEKKKATKQTGGSSITKGALGLGIQWSMLFGLTGVIGVLVIAVIGKIFDMEAVYGILVPYAFCQGPGQASNMGLIFETLYMIPNSQMVGLTFAVMGFLAAFIIGIPLAKYGIRKNLVKINTKISPSVERGYFFAEEQRQSMGKVTTHSGNIETLTLHIAFMGIAYIIAIILAEIAYCIPVLGPSFSGMLFIWGLVAASIVKKVLRKFNAEFLLNIDLQNKITGAFSDLVVVAAFMAIKVSVIGIWIIPIAIASAVNAIFIAYVCIFLTSRLGSDHDFERAVGMYGMCTGTTPSGIALLRIIDPKLQTPAATELGMTNLFLSFVGPITIAITLMGTEQISLAMTVAILLGVSILYLLMLNAFKLLNKPTFNLFTGEKFAVDEDGTVAGAGTFIQGVLAEQSTDFSGVVR
ncbi:MAG: hypothetical protein ATN34_02075 [Epulopiscium sp. Nele67-Bin002]|nr:MAG: hypothetical protein ATN34_02075 [Epulopiscium sp. Nele67-Bin002]